MSVLVLNASRRSEGVAAVERLSQFCDATSFDTFFQATKQNSEKLSNSDWLCVAASVGSRSSGAASSVRAIATCTPFSSVKEKDTSRGLVVSTPVYFGDRSSLAELFFSALSAGELSGKVFAALSVGAKRNGGQETANIFLLWEALSKGAVIVGDGPPNSQFGGTAVAGDKGEVLNDRLGLESAFRTGRRVAEVSRLLGHAARTKPRIGVLTVSEAGSAVDRRVKEIARELGELSMELATLDDFPLKPCLACDVCPIPELLVRPSDYACVIQDPHDHLMGLRRWLMSLDGLVLAGQGNTLGRYQEFLERTRVLRRNDFELSNLPVTTFSLEFVSSQQSLFALRAMTAFLRHNAILCPPLREVWNQERPLIESLHHWKAFADRAGEIAAARKNIGKQTVQYLALGYKDKRLDHTESAR